MRKLTETELAVMDHFHIVPNNFNEEGELPSPRDIMTWCIDNGYMAPDAPALSGVRILNSLQKKLWDDFEYDAISLEDVATWVLSHYFTLEQLETMQPTDAENFLKDWKYFFGFRKCDGWGDSYIYDAICALRGELVLDPQSREYVYVKGQLGH